jgi:suppressor of ftsI
MTIKITNSTKAMGIGILLSGLIIILFLNINQNKDKQESKDLPMAGYPCHQMGGQWMGDCIYDEDDEVMLDVDGKALQKKDSIKTSEDKEGEFSTSTEKLDYVLETQIVELKNDDIYELSAGYVKQIIEGKEVRRLAYNGMIPGPTIKAEKDSRVVVNFTNNLDFDTTIHAHGLRGESKFDGVIKKMGGEQDPVKPGESFTYLWDFPDAGLFWYHPHIRTDYTTDAGLQGNFWVTEDDYWNNVDKEELLIVDDITIDEPFFIDRAIKTLMGRFGTIMFINNKTDYNLDVKTGETVRFFMTNTANTRTFDISVEGIEVKLVGSDIGRIEKEQIVKNIIVAPSERYIFEASFEKAGIYKIMSRDKIIGNITVSGKNTKITKVDLRTNSDDFKVINDSIGMLLDKDIDKRLVIDIDMSSMPMIHKEDEREIEEIEWEDEMAMMNKMTDSKNLTWILRDVDTGKENMDIKWSFKKDSLNKIEIYNDPKSMHPMQHPIHFHGQKLAVISRDGSPVDSLQWEDTILVRNGERVEVILEATNAGNWLTHCHISEHAESGMRFNFDVY